MAVTQDPGNLRDYIRQTRRWAVGLWQTVRRHPPRANLFSAMLALLLAELVTSSLLLLMLPPTVLILGLPHLVPAALAWPGYANAYAAVGAHVRLSGAFFGLLVPDFAVTCLAALMERQPRLLLYGVFLPVMRLLDAAIGLAAIPTAWLTSSAGRWQSPARRAVPGLPAAAGPPSPSAVPPRAVSPSAGN